MSIQQVTQQVQDNEQYRIRSSKSEQAQQVQQTVQTEQHAAVQTDEYDKANPVGESVEGIYSVSHDDEGNLKVNYTQPASKTEAKTESQSEPKAEASQGQKASAGAGAAPSATSTSSESDDELEELKKQEEQLKAQLNRETDEGTKQALRAQLQSIEMQIAMKSAGVNS